MSNIEVAVQDPVLPSSSPSPLVVGIVAGPDAPGEPPPFFASLPAGQGLIILYVRHLDVKGEAWSGGAGMPGMSLAAASEGGLLRPDVIHLVDFEESWIVRAGRFVTAPGKRYRGSCPCVVDFFRSLAAEFGSRAVGIALAGSGTEGRAALREIRTAGGMTIAESPSGPSGTGQRPDGAVDLFLPSSEIGPALERFVEFLSGRDEALFPGATAIAGERPEGLVELAGILGLHHAIDITRYRPEVVWPRVMSGMARLAIDQVPAYFSRLRNDGEERQQLVKTLLLELSEFFRDTTAFETLRHAFVEELIATAGDDPLFRVWVAGCGTGEEAYSIAILFLDCAERLGREIRLQVFATDIDPGALTIARRGWYPASIRRQLSPERLGRYFSADGVKGYNVLPILRDRMLFSRHDLLEDPPFSGLDLVSCRNVIGYLNLESQRRAIQLLHFSLSERGGLFLGSTENVAAEKSLFQRIGEGGELYRKSGRASLLSLTGGLAGSAKPRYTAERESHLPGPQPAAARRQPASSELVRSALLEAHVPPTLVISSKGNILYVHGDLTPFVRIPGGEPRFQLLDVVRPELEVRVWTALHRSRRDGEPVVVHHFSELEPGRMTKITATPVPGVGEGCVMISFQREVAGDGELPANDEGRLALELDETRHDLEDTREALESSYEELRVSYEASRAVNEDLEVCRAELEATVEEVRATN